MASENFPRDSLTHLLSKEAFDDRLLISECERFDKSFAVMDFNKEAQKTILEGLGCYVMQGNIFDKNKF